MKLLCLQLPQEPRSKCNINDMMPYMLLERDNNKYIQQCIFSMASICDGSEGQFLTDFKKTMECAQASKKFRLAWSKHEKEFKFDYLFHCFFNTSDEAFPNKDYHQGGVMCGLAALHNAAALGH